MIILYLFAGIVFIGNLVILGKLEPCLFPLSVNNINQEQMFWLTCLIFSTCFSIVSGLCLKNTMSFVHELDNCILIYSQTKEEDTEKFRKTLNTIRSLNFAAILITFGLPVGFLILCLILPYNHPIYDVVFVFTDFCIFVVFGIFLAADLKFQSTQLNGIDTNIERIKRDHRENLEAASKQLHDSSDVSKTLHSLMRGHQLIKYTIKIVDIPGLCGSGLLLVFGFTMYLLNFPQLYQFGFIAGGLILTLAITQLTFRGLDKLKSDDHLKPWFEPIIEDSFQGYGVYSTINKKGK